MEGIIVNSHHDRAHYKHVLFQRAIIQPRQTHERNAGMVDPNASLTVFAKQLSVMCI